MPRPIGYHSSAQCHNCDKYRRVAVIGKNQLCEECLDAAKKVIKTAEHEEKTAKAVK
jgi:hypothetical protein